MTNAMPIVEAQSIHKTFDHHVAVDDVSFELGDGEVMGLVGPNGAGKTTTIRMLLDIIRPDQGNVLLFGEPFAKHHRSKLGYLPEERGLYRDLRVNQTLEYLAALKGMPGDEIKRRGTEVLERLGMAEHGDQKVSELSRGMSQLIGLAVTIIHRPRLLILDEPFANLDPLNVRLLKEVLSEVRSEGSAIILSTHQMNQVEELCDRVLMIDRGKAVLSGTLKEVRSGFGEGSIMVQGDALPTELPGVQEVRDHGSYMELVMNDESSSKAVFRALADSEAEIRRFEVAALPLEEIFIRVVGRTEE